MLKYISPLLLCLLQCHSVDQNPCNYDNLYTATSVPIADLYQLEGYSAANDLHLDQKDRLLLVFLSQVSCTTCVHRDVQLLADYQDQLASDVAVVILADTENVYYIHQLRRLNKLKFPILRYDSDLFDYTFLNRLHFMEIDLSTSLMKSSYVPDPEPRFEACTKDYLTRFCKQ